MEFESAQVKRCIRALKEIDFDLAYLAVLTSEGFKPLSRWEKPLDERELELLRQLGLATKQVPRTVQIGKEVIETVLSRTGGYIQLYERHFAGQPIDKSPETIRFEGFLFGYPPCCIEQYVRQPYAANNLPTEDQKILFHWACKDCKITPLLVPIYKDAHALVCNC